MRVKKGDSWLKIKPDSYRALLEQQEAAISAAKATNLQQKATMMEDGAGLSNELKICSTKKLISAQDYNAAEAATDVARILTKSSLHEMRTRTSELEPGRAISFPRPPFIRPMVGRSPF